MSQQSKGNVVAIGDHRSSRSRLSRQQSAQMVADCRHLAIERMAGALSGMLDRIEDDLFDLAEQAGDRESQNALLDARTQARDKRTLIEETFRRHFVQMFDRRVDGRPVPASVREDDAELKLVEEDELADKLALEEMARKLRDSCEDELFALNQRLGFLLDRPELGDEGSPLSPAAVCASSMRTSSRAACCPRCGATSARRRHRHRRVRAPRRNARKRRPRFPLRHRPCRRGSSSPRSPTCSPRPRPRAPPRCRRRS
jgi:hypothetical protein